MVMEPSSSHISLPKFQLKVISMRKPITSQGIGLLLPSFLHYQKDLRYVDLSGNNLSGPFPSWLLEYNTNYINGIDLSCNNLTGFIPPELGNLSQIYSLNLSHNNLVGVIPSSFSKLHQIESLDLSHNNLSGEIPNQLVELNNLKVFSVAYNNLSGSIPEPKGSIENSYEGNLFLCGPLLNKSCSKTDPPSTISTASNDHEGEDSWIDKYIFRASFLASYAVMLLATLFILYINPCWRRTWFSLVEKCITTCRYSAVGNFLAYHISRRCALLF